MPFNVINLHNLVMPLIVMSHILGIGFYDSFKAVVDVFSQFIL